MDRAHRLGQRRTVNVYRLLTRGTLEEKIMGLQQFKLDVAAAVVNQDNVSLSAMDTGRLLDLFSVQVGPFFIFLQFLFLLFFVFGPLLPKRAVLYYVLLFHPCWYFPNRALV